MIFVLLLPMLKAESCDGNVSENKDYQQCETTANLQYIECTNTCQDNPACLSDCSRSLVNEINQCPCMEGKYTLTDKKKPVRSKAVLMDVPVQYTLVRV